jgi:hypothetical protein
MGFVDEAPKLNDEFRVFDLLSVVVPSCIDLIKVAFNC